MFLFGTLAVLAQPSEHPVRKHDWGQAAVWSPNWSSSAGHSEILEDELTIRLKNLQPRFLSLFFHRRKVIRFANEEDIVRFARFSLPESLDPLYDAREAEYGSDIHEARPKWFNVRLDAFAARIIRPDGTWGEVGAFEEVLNDQVRTWRTLEPAWTYLLDLQAIAPGDVVEVVWSYMVPYDVNAERTAGWRAFEWPDNWTRTTSWRILFHHSLPIRHQRVVLDYDHRHGLLLGGTSFFSTQNEGGRRVTTWEHHDLPGCLDEVNARPAADLPFASITLQPDDIRYWTRDRLSGMPYEAPYWLYVLRIREDRAFWWRRVAHKNVPDRQNELFNAFVEETTIGLPPDARARKAQALHNRIAAEFTYTNDSLWYVNVDTRLPRYGDQVTDARMREMARYDLYSKLLFAIGAEHSTAYLMDSRVGRMDARWLTPLWESDLLFGVPDVDGTLWMHPKRGANGLWAGELPFYWAGSPALIMYPALLATDATPPPLFRDLPAIPESATMRVIETTIDSADARYGSTGMQRVFVSGQFSTLGRASYAGAIGDRTVHPGYGAPRIPGTDAVPAWRIRSSSSSAPYRFQADRGFDGAAVSINDTSGLVIVHAADLVHHAVPAPFDPALRDLPFYWDTPQDDRLVVDVHFQHPMELAGPALDRWVSSSQASIAQRFTLIDPKHLRFESRLEVTGDREEPVFAADVAEVLRFAAGQDMRILLRKVPEAP